jgi:hypothetical protein
MKKTPLPNIITLMILSLITTVFWVFFNIYRAFKKVPEVNVPPGVLAPLDANLNMDALNSLEKRFYLEDSLIPQAQPATSSPSPQPEPTAATVTSQETATPAASLEM